MPNEILIAPADYKEVSYKEADEVGQVALETMAVEVDPAASIHEEFPGLSPRPERNPASPQFELIEEHKKKIEQLMENPEVWQWENREPLLAELTALMKLTTEQHQAYLIEDDELLEVSNLSLSVMAKYVLSKTKDSTFHIPSGGRGYEPVVNPLTELLQLSEKIKPPTMEEDALATRILIGISGAHRYQAHKKFVDKHLSELQKAPPESETGTLIRSPEFISMLGIRATDVIDKYGRLKNQPEERELFYKGLEFLGFDEAEQADLVKAWTSYRKTEVVQKAIEKNVQNMATLLTAGETAPHEVYSKFGIRHFSRYRPETLHRQSETLAGNDRMAYKQRPIKLVVSATSDWNGALRDQETRFGAVIPIYTEAGNLIELARRLLIVRKKFGQINNLILSGHGNEHLIELSGDCDISEDTLHKSEALANIRNKGIFTPGAEIILASCSVGAEGGIAEKVSKISGMDVIAPHSITGGRLERDPTKREGYKVVFPGQQAKRSYLAKLLKKEGNVGIHLKAGKRKRLKTLELGD